MECKLFPRNDLSSVAAVYSVDEIERFCTSFVRESDVNKPWLSRDVLVFLINSLSTNGLIQPLKIEQERWQERTRQERIQIR